MNSYEEKQEARRQRYLDRAEKAKNESNALYNEAHKMADVIPFGQPILIGHHSEGRDRRYRGRIHDKFGKAFAALDKSTHYEEKAARVGTGGISSDDPDALQKLRAKLEKLQCNHNLMKSVNSIIRVAKSDKGCIATLMEIGIPEKQAQELIKPDCFGYKGFAPFMLANNRNNIISVKKRIVELEAQEQRKDKREETALYIYREDSEENRVMFEFDGKPSLDIRNVLKRHGFKWSPRRLTWVRYLNNNGLYAAQEVRKHLDAMN